VRSIRDKTTPVAPLPADDSVMFVEDIATRLDVHPKTVAKLPIRYKRVGRRRVYLAKWVREYLEGAA